MIYAPVHLYVAAAVGCVIVLLMCVPIVPIVFTSYALCSSSRIGTTERISFARDEIIMNSAGTRSTISYPQFPLLSEDKPTGTGIPSPTRSAPEKLNMNLTKRWVLAPTLEFAPLV